MHHEDTAFEKPVHPLFGQEDHHPHPKTCYFWVDEREEEQFMAVMCEECHKTNSVGWQWHGSKGFGPYDYVCKFCKKVIHKHEENGSQNDKNPPDVQG